jgi:hypothetical protein
MANESFLDVGQSASLLALRTVSDFSSGVQRRSRAIEHFFLGGRKKFFLFALQNPQ